MRPERGRAAAHSDPEAAAPTRLRSCCVCGRLPRRGPPSARVGPSGSTPRPTATRRCTHGDAHGSRYLAPGDAQADAAHGRAPAAQGPVALAQVVQLEDGAPGPSPQHPRTLSFHVRVRVLPRRDRGLRGAAPPAKATAGSAPAWGGAGSPGRSDSCADGTSVPRPRRPRSPRSAHARVCRPGHWPAEPPSLPGRPSLDVRVPETRCVDGPQTTATSNCENKLSPGFVLRGRARGHRRRLPWLCCLWARHLAPGMNDASIRSPRGLRSQ